AAEPVKEQRQDHIDQIIEAMAVGRRLTVGLEPERRPVEGAKQELTGRQNFDLIAKFMRRADEGETVAPDCGEPLADGLVAILHILRELRIDPHIHPDKIVADEKIERSEERRVGKESSTGEGR